MGIHEFSGFVVKPSTGPSAVEIAEFNRLYDLVAEKLAEESINCATEVNEATFRGVPLVWDDGSKPDFILVGRQIYDEYLRTFDRRRSKSHARKTQRERLARCAVGVHSWTSYHLDVCIACGITREEFTDANPNP